MSLSVYCLDVPEIGEITASSQGQQPFSAARDTVVGAKDLSYATLESGQWTLDGSKQLLPDTPKGMWWSSQISDGQGNFKTPLVLQYNLEQSISTSGITFTFCPAEQLWCSKVQIRWYREGQLVSQIVAAPDRPKWVLQHAVEGYDQVQIVLYSTNIPNRFAKIQKIELGQNKEFTEEELVSVRHKSKIDALLCSVTPETMEVVLRNQDNIRFLPHRHKLKLFKDGQLIATHRICSGSRQGSDFYTIRSEAGAGLLEERFFGGVYTNVPLDSLLKQIFGVGNYILHPLLSGEKISGYLPACTKAKALQQLMFAAGAQVFVTEDGNYSIRPLNQSVAGSFGKESIFADINATTYAPYGRVELSAHTYTPSEKVVTLLHQHGVYGHNVLFTFSTPHHSYQITGGTLVETGANYLRISASGPVTVLAKTYSHTAQICSKENPAATPEEETNTLRIHTMTLIHNGNVQRALERVYALAQYRQEFVQKVNVQNQKAGHYAISLSPWNTKLGGYLVEKDSTFTHGSQQAKICILGAELPLEGRFRYSGEVYAGEQEVVY